MVKLKGGLTRRKGGGYLSGEEFPIIVVVVDSVGESPLGIGDQRLAGEEFDIRKGQGVVLQPELPHHLNLDVSWFRNREVPAPRCSSPSRTCN